MDLERAVSGIAIALLACSAACAPAPVHAPGPAAPPQKPTVTEGNEPTIASLRAMIERINSLRGCKDDCCTGPLPEVYRRRAWVGTEDARHAPALRRIMDGPAPADVRAVAALRLSFAMDLSDLPRFARCVDSTEPAGVFPGVLVGQARRECELVDWEDKTLGRACLEAAGGVLATDFANAAAFHAWYRAHPDPGRTFEYWKNLLTESSSPPVELQEKLRTTEPELYFRVVSLHPEIVRESDDAFVRHVREKIGTERLFRLLRRQESFPEIEEDEAFGRFAATVLARAERLFAPGDAASLAALLQGSVFANLDYPRAVLAVAASRIDVARAADILHGALDSVGLSRDLVLREIARRRPVEDRELLRAWYYRKHAHQSVPEGILQGLAEAGPAGRPALAGIAKGGGPRPDEQMLVDTFMTAARAVGYGAPPECEGSLRTRLTKGMSQGACEQAEREALPRRARCVAGAVKWLQGGR